MSVLRLLRTAILLLAGVTHATPIVISTTSGQLHGVDQGGVMSFKAIRYGQPPVGANRWQPPIAFASNDIQDATQLGPSCIQQFNFDTAVFIKSIVNNPPPLEDEDCLLLNVWAPSGDIENKKPVVFWIHGGGLSYGTASIPTYDGTSIALNQNIVVVTINYRTNVFGFPAAPDLPSQGNNLGFLDQDLALNWVQQNIANFGGDATKVTIMGQSAGGLSVSTALARHSQATPPFRAAIMLSGNIGQLGSTPDSFNQFATAIGCTDAPGPSRIACLKTVSAENISAYENGPDSPGFGRVTLDGVTAFDTPLARVRAHQTARVPILLGNTKDDGSLFAFVSEGGGQTTDIKKLLPAFLRSQGLSTPDLEQRILDVYNDLDEDPLAATVRDFTFQCPAQLWANSTVTSGINDVYRYIYGAVFADLQVFPGAGAAHASELPNLFGTYNRTTATTDEATLSSTFQTTIGNFVKNPNASPAPNWASYDNGNVAKLAFDGNVELDDVVELVTSASVDASCELWDMLLGDL